MSVNMSLHETLMDFLFNFPHLENICQCFMEEVGESVEGFLGNVGITCKLQLLSSVFVESLLFIVWKIQFHLIWSIIWLCYTKGGWFQFSSAAPFYAPLSIYMENGGVTLPHQTSLHCGSNLPRSQFRDKESVHLLSLFQSNIFSCHYSLCVILQSHTCFPGIQDSVWDMIY